MLKSFACRIGKLVIVLGMSSIAFANPVERQLEVQGPEGPLAGTLLSPSGNGGHPVVLIIPGSGHTDRDGNSPLGIKAATYRLLAEGLAEQGIASVRIDKRGMFGSKKAVADANAVTIADYAGDVHRWVAAARQEADAPCVWLLGHSEGGLVALAAAQGAQDLCGIVLAAVPGRPLGRVLWDQLEGYPANAPILDHAEGVIRSLENGDRVDVSGFHPALQQLFAPAVQGFLIDAFSLEPTELLASLDQPVLILQGRRDLQVKTGDAELLKQANPMAELALLSDANHVFKSVPTENQTANIATYGSPHLPLAAETIESIVQFIRANPMKK